MMNAKAMHTLADAYHNRRARIITFHKCFDFLDLANVLDIVMDVDITVREVLGGIPERLDFDHDSI